MKSRFRILTLTCCLFLTSIVTLAAFAADPPPLAILKTTANRMTGELNRHMGNLNDNLVSGIVRHILLPRFDLGTISHIVTGRYWSAANSATRKQFIDEFTDYVIRTYTAALVNYDGEVIKFYPIRGYSNGMNRVRINSKIMQKAAPPVNVQYRLLRKGSNWFIYDFSVDGVSLVENYRSQFAATLRKGGLNYLVQELARKNR